MVKIIYGNEPYLIKYTRNDFLLRDSSDGKMNSKKCGSFDEAYEFISSNSLFGGVRLAVVTVPKLSDLDNRLFKEYVKQHPAQREEDFSKNSQCILIILDEPRINKKSKLFKEIAPFCLFQRFDKLNAQQLQVVLSNFLKKYGLEMDSDAKKVFLDRLSYADSEEVSLFTMRHELEILGSLSKTITAQLISDNVPNYSQTNSFFLITKIRDKNMDELMQDLEKLEREKSFSAVKTLALLSREYNIAYKMSLGFKNNDIGISSSYTLKNIPATILLNGMVILNECTHNIKQGIMNEKQALRYAVCCLTDDMV